MRALQKIQGFAGKVLQSEVAVRVYMRLFRTRATRPKEDWELEWQGTQQCALFSQHENQHKCEEYGFRYRHPDNIR